MRVRPPRLFHACDLAVIGCGLSEAGAAMRKLAWLPRNGQEDVINSCLESSLFFSILNNFVSCASQS